MCPLPSSRSLKNILPIGGLTSKFLTMSQSARVSSGIGMLPAGGKSLKVSLKGGGQHVST